jgi:Rnl2 family RNA ligase
MEFKKYNSIENSFQESFIQAIIEQGLGDAEYVVQEKVHGANMSIMTDGVRMLAAKRTELIADGEDFYNWRSVVEGHRERVLQLHKEVSARYGTATTAIFGELFGGGYPHPDVPMDASAKLVQRGVYYCPHNDFYAFDILLDNGTFLDAETANALFERHGLRYAKTLFKGSLSECLAHPNAFKTTLPQEYGLPELEGNLCEGVVIRPVVPSFLRSGSRVLIKNKNEQWAENNRHIDKDILSRLLHEGEELSEDASQLCEEMFRLITRNRLDNVISKIGEVNPRKDLGRLLGMFNKDVLSDFLKAHEGRYNALEKHESKEVTKFLNKHAGRLIDEYFGR